ncbi:olfactory receptor 11A1-like [Haliotis rubra]|uniref:olfactory receptor 11A1-like n=1 Tax=Haliotis rubra TaxID=36100 RepID=UPI001EE51AE3|nr:olfactory receptor 11A1-like [Haliotis rubra]
MNSTTDMPIRDTLSQSGTNVTVTILMCVLVIAPVGDLLILVTILQTRKLRRPLYLLMANIFLSDICFVTISLPLNIATLLHGFPPYGTVVCYIQSFVTFGAISSSACAICSIAVYRLTQVCWSSVYIRISTWKYMSVVMAAVWTVPVVMAAAVGGSVEYIDYKFTCDHTGPHLDVVSITALYLPIVATILGCYVKLYLHTKNALQRVQAVMTLPLPAASHDVNRKMDDVIFRCIMIIFVEFIGFYVGPGVLNAIRNKSDPPSKGIIGIISFSVYRIHPLVRMCTSVVLNKELRDAVLKLVRVVNVDRRR